MTGGIFQRTEFDVKPIFIERDGFAEYSQFIDMFLKHGQLSGSDTIYIDIIVRLWWDVTLHCHRRCGQGTVGEFLVLAEDAMPHAVGSSSIHTSGTQG